MPLGRRTIERASSSASVGRSHQGRVTGGAREESLMKHRGIMAFALGVVLVSGCAEGRYRSRMVNKAAPDFELSTLDGGTAKLSAFRGKPVVLAFWAYG